MVNIANNSLCHCNDMHPSKLTVVIFKLGFGRKEYFQFGNIKGTPLT